MKCPNCGWEMQDGHLICEQCGQEIQIVPDFDPDLEVQIDNRVVDELLETSVPEEKDHTETAEIDLDYSSIKNRAVALIVIVIVSIALITGSIWLVLKINSYEYKVNKAKSLSAAGKYEEAISTLENLHVSSPDKSELFLLESDYYNELGRNDMAADTLKRMISSDLFSEDEIMIAYDRLFSIYVELEDYDAINEELKNCEYSEVVTAYQNYMAIEPAFSIEGGEYTESQWLKLSANTSGSIYYTTDGSIPNKDSTLYGGPIALEHGSYVISAVFINKYRVSSEVVVNTYELISDIPDAPVVNLESGDYHSPNMITVEVPEGSTVYYTTDKSIPTIDSVKYTDPIPMPVNYSNFNFIVINEQGLSSEVVMRSYYLVINGGISPADAVNILKGRLVELGLLTDVSGASDRAPGVFTYETISAISIEGQGDFYTIREFLHDGAGMVTPTDTTYIVDIYQGSTAILGGNAVNGFIANSL